eukprot:4028886-Pleurochrysis_carterae.AAC.2
MPTRVKSSGLISGSSITSRSSRICSLRPKRARTGRSDVGEVARAAPRKGLKEQFWVRTAAQRICGSVDESVSASARETAGAGLE